MIAITGARGQLGSAFRSLLGDGAVYLSRTDLDLTRPEEIRSVVARLRPDVLINCAAYTAVDAAETDHQTAHLVNGRAVGVLAEAVAAAGGRLVTFSTDYVFDGRSSEPYVESSPTNPLSVYGASKLEGEALALQTDPATLVIRTSWLLSGTHPNFAATMLRLAAAGPLRVVDDQRGRPTVVDDLARATLAAVDSGATGILHLCNDGETSWYGLAREVLEIGGFDPGLVSPCSTAEFPRPAPRPANSVLDSERRHALGLEPMPHYRAALTAAVQRLAA